MYNFLSQLSFKNSKEDSEEDDDEEVVPKKTEGKIEDFLNEKENNELKNARFRKEKVNNDEKPKINTFKEFLENFIKDGDIIKEVDKDKILKQYIDTIGDHYIKITDSLDDFLEQAATLLNWNTSKFYLRIEEEDLIKKKENIIRHINCNLKQDEHLTNLVETLKVLLTEKGVNIVEQKNSNDKIEEVYEEKEIKVNEDTHKLIKETVRSLNHNVLLHSNKLFKDEIFNQLNKKWVGKNANGKIEDLNKQKDEIKKKKIKDLEEFNNENIKEYNQRIKNIDEVIKIEAQKQIDLMNDLMELVNANLLATKLLDKKYSLQLLNCYEKVRVKNNVIKLENCIDSKSGFYPHFVKYFVDCILLNTMRGNLVSSNLKVAPWKKTEYDIEFFETILLDNIDFGERINIDQSNIDKLRSEFFKQKNVRTQAFVNKTGEYIPFKKKKVNRDESTIDDEFGDEGDTSKI